MEGKQLENFGTDLLIFGIKHDLPDAVRIGENLSALNDEDVPEHVKEMLQNYILENSKRLRESINFTGPMKGIISTRKQHLMASSDSPYLPQHYDKLMAFDKYNRWRLPSIYASDYKKRGDMDNIFGKEKLDKIEEYIKMNL